MNLSDGIRSLEIDLDKEILKINGQKRKNIYNNSRREGEKNGSKDIK